MNSDMPISAQGFTMETWPMAKTEPHAHATACGWFPPRVLHGD
jgi:hypothetical protein